jgi:PD-(D/E)XK endonuclease
MARNPTRGTGKHANPIRCICEHVFVVNPNVKGNIAELEIALAAERAGIVAYKPIGEHGRTDLVLEIADRLHRVQCKWGRLAADESVIAVQVSGSRLTPQGYVRSPYRAEEVDLVGVYCGATDRCYLLPPTLFVDKYVVHLRLVPPKNGQRSCINLAEQYEFKGAVAQLEERRHGMAEVRGSSPLSSIEEPPMTIGSDEFRNRLGYYLDLAAEGQELNITRWGKRFLRVTLWQPSLPQTQAA